MSADVRIIASDRNWIEGEAVRQLHQTATLQGMSRVVGMPDLHPGKGSPIGAAFAADGWLHPFLVGNDIGCGMGLWTTDLKRRKVKLDRWVKRLRGVEGPWDGDAGAWLADRELAPSGHEASLGTVGGGNHFAEVQAVEQVHDETAAAALGLSSDRLLLLVHSGSRGFGHAILQDHVARFRAEGLPADSDDGRAYLARHDHAVEWARANRALIAERFLERLNGDGELALDVCHNSVTAARLGGCDCWLHRKGAAPADRGPVVIPGSRGTLSYLVAPLGDGEANAQSLAHGAGRRWKRSEAKPRLRSRFSPDDLTRTALGGRVICEDRDLLYEEAPQAYKDVDVVVQDLADAGALSVIATLRPLITYKKRARR